MGRLMGGHAALGPQDVVVKMETAELIPVENGGAPPTSLAPPSATYEFYLGGPRANRLRADLQGNQHFFASWLSQALVARGAGEGSGPHVRSNAVVINEIFGDETG